MNAKTTPPTPRNWSDLDEYIKPAHLRGAVVPVAIDRIEFRTLHPKPGVEEIKPVMYFAGKQKGLILTSHNQDTLRAAFGDEIAACYGKQVSLRAETVKVAGKMVDTIRIVIAQQPQAEQAN
ncbi:MAG: hypothetical protein ACOYYS_19200 [Chloroflexota bacterium]